MVSLKASWQTQKNQRQQELVQRQQQVRQSLTGYQQERQVKAAALRDDLNVFQQSLQQETQDFLIDLNLDRQLRSERVAQQLHDFAQALQQQTADFLEVTAADRSLMSQELAQDLATFHTKLFQHLSEFRAELKAYCNIVHETVWGKSVAIQQSEPTIQKPIMLKSDRATPETFAQKPVAYSVAQPVTQPVTQPRELSPAKLPTIPISSTQSAAVIKQPTQHTLQQDNELLQKLYSYIKQIEGARLTEIQSALGINRSQTVDSLRALIKQGLITQRDRLYLAQEEISL